LKSNTYIFIFFYILLFIQSIIFCQGFIEGTLVLTPSGAVEIEKLQKNDLVLTYNFLTHKIESQQILSTYNHYSQDLVHIEIDDEKIITDHNHTFFCNSFSSQWKNAKNIELNDSLLNSTNESIKIKKITLINEYKKLYCLYVKKNHNFFVGRHNILVHNFLGAIISAFINEFAANYTFGIVINFFGLGLICKKIKDKIWTAEPYLDTQIINNHLQNIIYPHDYIPRGAVEEYIEIKYCSRCKKKDCKNTKTVVRSIIPDIGQGLFITEPYFENESPIIYTNPIIQMKPEDYIFSTPLQEINPQYYIFATPIEEINRQYYIFSTPIEEINREQLTLSQAKDSNKHKKPVPLSEYEKDDTEKISNPEIHNKSRKEPGMPTNHDGFEVKDDWNGKLVRPDAVKIKMYGYPDNYGNIWVSSGASDNPSAHGGPHWDVQHPDTYHTNVHPGGKIVVGPCNFKPGFCPPLFKPYINKN
jgi:hypothetical protein